MASKACCFHFFYWVVLLFTIVIALVAIILPSWVVNDNMMGSISGFTKAEMGPLTACYTTAAGDKSCGRWGYKLRGGKAWRGTNFLHIIAVSAMIVSLILTTVTFCGCYGAQKAQAGLVIFSSIAIVIAMFLFGAGLDATNTVDGEIATEFGMNCGPNADQFNRDACELGSGAGMAVAAAIMTMITGAMACFVKVGDDVVA